MAQLKEGGEKEEEQKKRRKEVLRDEWKKDVVDITIQACVYYPVWREASSLRKKKKYHGDLPAAAVKQLIFTINNNKKTLRTQATHRKLSSSVQF